MKTRERILLTSLYLFNTEGEPNVTTVDIANELDISPGNLYYHFKGKEQIIAELYQLLELELSEILAAPANEGINIRDAWLYLYVVFEQIYKHRYFYCNLNDILSRYPEINRRFRRLLKAKVGAAQTVTSALQDHGVIEIREEQRLQLSENLGMALTFWLNYEQMRQQGLPEQLLMHQGVFQVVSMVAPYFTPGFSDIYDTCAELFSELSQASLENPPS